MKLIAYIRSVIAGRFHRSEIEDEFAAHVHMRADDLERSGLDRAEAERRARVEFGGHGKFTEESREEQGGVWLENLVRDVRFSAYLLRRSPAFSVVAVLTLALAIAASSAAFAALNAIILRPLNVARPTSLYSLHRVTDNSGGLSYPTYIDIRDRNRSFEDLAAYNIVQAGLDTGEYPSRAWVVSVSGNYFDVLGVQPHLGRLFHRSDEKGLNSAPYIVLSYAYWQSRFQSDPGVVGRVVQVNKHPFTIIGVTPRGFTGTLLFFSPDFFVPLVNQGEIEPELSLTSRGVRWLFLSLGHLRDGVTPEQAAADISAVYADIARTHPTDHSPAAYTLARPSLYGEFVGRPARAFISAVMLLAGLILLAACANLGSLFSARASDRSREMALRLALGASRLRIIRQLFTEAMLLAIIGGAVGLWCSTLLLQWATTWQPFPQFPINVPIAPDATVYAVALLLALVSGVLFGSVPVRQVLRTDPYEIVKAGTRTTHGRKVGARDLLLVLQIAICALLVTSSMVAVRGLNKSLRGDFGFDPRDSMLVETVPGMAGHRGDAVPALQKRMVEAMTSIPGVEMAALVDVPPLFNGSLNSVNVYRDDTNDVRPANATTVAVTYRISPEYLEAARTPVLAGRSFTWHDDRNAPRVAMINPEFARRVFGSPERALGGYFKMRGGARIKVVGIVPDGKYQNLTEAPRAALFFPILQAPSSHTYMVVRSKADPQQFATAIRAKLREIDPSLPTFIETWNEGMNLVLFPSRVAAVALGVLGIMGALLSVTGVFGMAAYSVSRRMKELGIRIALGAQKKELLSAALGRALRVLAFGSTAGLVLGLMAGRVLASIVYQATPRDPYVLAGVAFAMLCVGLLATWIPAQRALAVDPLTLLREE